LQSNNSRRNKAGGSGAESASPPNRSPRSSATSRSNGPGKLAGGGCGPRRMLSARATFNSASPTRRCACMATTGAPSRSARRGKSISMPRRAATSTMLTATTVGNPSSKTWLSK
jgi:hypothetical protein